MNEQIEFKGKEIENTFANNFPEALKRIHNLSYPDFKNEVEKGPGREDYWRRFLSEGKKEILDGYIEEVFQELPPKYFAEKNEKGEYSWYGLPVRYGVAVGEDNKTEMLDVSGRRDLNRKIKAKISFYEMIKAYSPKWYIERSFLNASGEKDYLYYFILKNYDKLKAEYTKYFKDGDVPSVRNNFSGDNVETPHHTGHFEPNSELPALNPNTVKELSKFKTENPTLVARYKELENFYKLAVIDPQKNGMFRSQVEEFDYNLCNFQGSLSEGKITEAEEYLIKAEKAKADAFEYTQREAYETKYFEEKIKFVEDTCKNIGVQSPQYIGSERERVYLDYNLMDRISWPDADGDYANIKLATLKVNNDTILAKSFLRRDYYRNDAYIDFIFDGSKDNEGDSDKWWQLYNPVKIDSTKLEQHTSISDVFNKKKYNKTIESNPNMGGAEDAKPVEGDLGDQLSSIFGDSSKKKDK